MKEKRVTQAGIAAYCKVAQSAVSNWLKGAMPGGVELILLARYLELRVEDLFEEGNQENAEALRTGDGMVDSIESWKKRTKLAEDELNQLRDGLRQLLDARNQLVHQPGKRRTSSKSTSVLAKHEGLLSAAEDTDKKDRES